MFEGLVRRCGRDGGDDGVEHYRSSEDWARSLPRRRRARRRASHEETQARFNNAVHWGRDFGGRSSEAPHGSGPLRTGSHCGPLRGDPGQRAGDDSRPGCCAPASEVGRRSPEVRYYRCPFPARRLEGYEIAKKGNIGTMEVAVIIGISVVGKVTRRVVMPGVRRGGTIYLWRRPGAVDPFDCPAPRGRTTTRQKL